MKNKKSFILTFVLLLCFGAMLFTGCSSQDPTLVLESNFKTEYYLGETIDLTNAKVKYTNNKGKEETFEVTIDMISGFETTSVGEFVLTITYEGLEVSVDYVVKKPATLVLVSTFKTTYYVGDDLDLTGGTIKYTNDDGAETTTAITNNMVNNFDTSSAGNKTLTVTYQGLTISINYVVKNPSTLSMFVPFKTNYVVGESLNVNGGVVCYTDEDGNKQYAQVVSNMVENFNNTSAGDKTMTVKYQGLTLSVNYVVSDYADIKLDTMYYSTGNASQFNLIKMVKSGDKYDIYYHFSYNYADIPSLEYGFGGTKIAGFTRSVSDGVVKYTCGSIVITVLGENTLSYKNGTHPAEEYKVFADYDENSFYYTYDTNTNKYSYLKVERLQMNSRIQVYLLDTENEPSAQMNKLSVYEFDAEFIRFANNNVLEYTYTVNNVKNILVFTENSTVEFYHEYQGNRELDYIYTLYK